MKNSSRILFLLAIAGLPLASWAQKGDKVEVSPNLSKNTVVKKCKELDIGEVVTFVKPLYPEEARASRIGGTVEVRIKIDEKGDVVEILETKGHPRLKKAAVDAAKQAKFTPTICDGQLAQVNGLMIYNFIPVVVNDLYFTPKSVDEFIDISSDSAYYESIVGITENYGLAFGYSDKKFHENAPLTKGDFAHFLRLTLDYMENQASIAKKIPRDIGLFYSFNPERIKTAKSIRDFDEKHPYAKSVEFLVSKYDIGLVNKDRKFNGKFPMTQNEVIENWSKIFGKETVPVHFKKISAGDRIFTRGEFSLFLQESLYVLTYKVLP